MRKYQSIVANIIYSQVNIVKEESSFIMECITALRMTVDNDMKDLFERESTGQLSEDDFVRVWTDLIGLPMYWYEYVIESSEHTKNGYNRDQAVIYGLLTRMYKTMCYERRITCKRVNSRLFAFTFTRMIFDDAIKVQYFIKHPDEIDNYCISSLRGDKELLELISRNQSNRTEEASPDFIEWESGLKDRAEERFRKQGMDVREKLARITDMRKMLKDLDMEETYVLYAISSDSVHGGWASIHQEFLIEENGRYYPNFNDHDVDVRQILDIIQFCFITLKFFLESFHGHGIPQEILTEIIEDMNRINSLVEVNQNYVRNKPLNDLR